MTQNTPEYFLVHCLDAPQAQAKRAAAAAAHRRYVEAHRARILFGGPLLDDTGRQRLGSVIALRAGSRDEAQAFMDAEPYRMAGVFESVTIRAFDCVMGLTQQTKQEQE